MTDPDYVDLVRNARTFLFVPGNKPHRFATAAASGADVVIVDLEDAVDAADKDAARASVSDWVRAGHRVLIRINAADTEWYGKDLEMVASAGGAGIVVPKSRDPAELARVRSFLPLDAAMVPLIETASGVACASAISAVAGTTRTAFGSIDLAAELSVAADDRDAMAFARGMLVVAAAAAGLPGPVDGVTTAIRDADMIASDVRYARRLGLTAKLCIHPAQVPTVHSASGPSTDEVDWAIEVLAATGVNGSAVAVGGHMVDAPVVERAHQILKSARR
ncbi:HpcH/HpaI aldolase/citrate lyase family protein (plasmid) [Rhodococcoides fascians]|uniref:HpcH/HpaI aldolase/citrate lyase family protein n=1 Tax=Rhodococcoides fascians TaxID=1828 RepID=UPI00389B367B